MVKEKMDGVHGRVIVSTIEICTAFRSKYQESLNRSLRVF